MKKIIFGLAHDNAHAERIVARLQQAGFTSDEVDFHPHRGLPNNEPHTLCLISHKNETKAPEGGLIGGIIGGGLGAFLGGLAGVGYVALPGLGFLVAAGPLTAMLAGAGVGSWIGGIVGVLVGLCYREYEACHFKKGKVLVAVEAASCERADVAKDIFKKEDASDISCCHDKACCSKPKR